MCYCGKVWMGIIPPPPCPIHSISKPVYTPWVFETSQTVHIHIHIYEEKKDGACG